MLPVLKVMILGLVRDRSAFAMVFVLPPLIFMIFAAVFSGAGGADISVRVAIADTIRSEMSIRLVETLEAREAVVRIGGTETDEAAAEALVREGAADIGLVIRTGEAAPLAFSLLTDPSRAVAETMLTGHLGDALAAVRRGGPGPDLPIERRAVVGTAEVDSTIVYYAGAVAILFLMFAAVQGAITLLEERESGILDRIVVGPDGIGSLVYGKFAFILLQGMVQAAVIFVVAWLVYGVDLPGHLAAWFATTLAAAAGAAGLALLLVSACTSRRQALTLGNFLVLIVSAVGGSMVPRFLMPGWLQDLGWLTPNGWTLEAYNGIFWRGESIAATAPAWAVLAGSGLVALLLARQLSRRFETVSTV